MDIFCLSLISHDEGDIQNVVILFISATESTNDSLLCSSFLWTWKEAQKKKEQIIDIHMGNTQTPWHYLRFI